MTKLLITIPISDATAKQAENLIDWIYQLSGRKTHGHALIVLAKDVSPESREFIKISCELAFSQFEVIESPSGDLLLAAAQHISANYKWPFLWIEPSSVPLKRNWLSELSLFYESQPKPFVGAHLMAGERTVLSHTAIYPNVTNLNEGRLSKSTKCRLFQFGNYPCDLREDAVLFFHDRTQTLIPKLREELRPEIEAAKRMEKARAARGKSNV